MLSVSVIIFETFDVQFWWPWTKTVQERRSGILLPRLSFLNVGMMVAWRIPSLLNFGFFNLVTSCVCQLSIKNNDDDDDGWFAVLFSVRVVGSHKIFWALGPVRASIRPWSRDCDWRVVVCITVADINRDRKTVTFLDDYTEQVSRSASLPQYVLYLLFLFHLPNISSTNQWQFSSDFV